MEFDAIAQSKTFNLHVRVLFVYNVSNVMSILTWKYSTLYSKAHHENNGKKYACMSLKVMLKRYSKVHFIITITTSFECIEVEQFSLFHSPLV